MNHSCWSIPTVDHGCFGLDRTAATCSPQQTSDTLKMRSPNVPDGTYVAVPGAVECVWQKVSRGKPGGKYQTWGKILYFKAEDEGSYLQTRQVPIPPADEAKSLFYKKHPGAVLSSLPNIHPSASLWRSKEALYEPGYASSRGRWHLTG